MNRIFAFLPLLVVASLGLGSGEGRAQAVPDFTSSGADAALTRLFGEHTAFSADAVLRVYDTDEREVLTAAMGYAVRDDRVRMEVDMSRLKARQLPDGLAAGLKQAGMERVVSLILPEARASYLVYPGLNSVLRVPLDEQSLKERAADFTLTREPIGTETLDGRRCVKHRVTVTDASGGKQQAITWNAPALRDFPVQLQVADGENQVILRFRNVNLALPDAALFAVPAGYTEYTSQQALMQAVMLKALGDLGK